MEADLLILSAFGVIHTMFYGSHVLVCRYLWHKLEGKKRMQLLLHPIVTQSTEAFIIHIVIYGGKLFTFH